MKKNKLFITALFLIIGIKTFAQIDTLNVYLEKNNEHKFGVDLVFENNSNDTIFLFTQFENFTHAGIIPRYSGICIEFFSDNNPFGFNSGDVYNRFFIFSRGFTLIYPQSNVKLFFDIGEVYPRFPSPEETNRKYEISFFMNYSFAKYRYPDTTIQIIYFQTNRITMVEPNKEPEIQRE